MSEDFTRMSKKKKTLYLSAWGALYGDEKVGVQRGKGRVKSVLGKPRCPTEAQEQMALVKWCDLKRIPIIHIPNGGKRTSWGGHSLALQGLRKGVP